MVKGVHDTLVYRLAQILIKLNQGEKLVPEQLAEEFGVNRRTIQRDLNERFAYLPLVKADGRYCLDGFFLGKITHRDIKRFASLAGVKGLFPSLSNDFLRDIFDNRLESAILVKGHDYENLADHQGKFQLLEQAIIDHNQISFTYSKKGEQKNYNFIFPYKLINSKGIWYLAGADGDRLKTFSLAKMDDPVLLEALFDPDPRLLQMATEEDGIWFSDEKQEVLLKVAGEVADYFKRRKLIVNQVIEKEMDNGDLLITTKIGHINQVLSIVRYWIPHIRILSPDSLQETLNKELNNYIRQ